VPLDKLKAAWHAQVDAIPHVDLEFVGGAKHFVMLDQPEVFDGLLDKALAK
jgi:pimeloyl-ACP methyl ester carboxylesterase